MTAKRMTADRGFPLRRRYPDHRGSGDKLRAASARVCHQRRKIWRFVGTNGCLDIASSESDGKVLLTWNERGGPPIGQQVHHEGFGSILARMTVTGQFGGAIDRDWQPDGLRIALSIDRARLSSASRAT